MSSTASNYDLLRLNIGILVATMSLITALRSAFKTLLEAKGVGIWIALKTMAYAIMMFASSYVEEEQHFWYWMASAWLAWLFMKQ